MNRKQKFLFTLFMAIVMIAMSPQKVWADSDKPWLCFTAEEAGSTVKLYKQWGSDYIFETSTDGISWTTYTVGKTEDITLANVGDKVYFRYKADSPVSSFNKETDYHQFVMTGKIAASGNVMSLMDKSCATKAFTSSGEWAFNKLFENCKSLTAAPELPATTLAHYCYVGMFYGCTNLVTAPELPAVNLTVDCYASMFCGCKSLTKAPKLPATTMANHCYSQMFKECSSLKTAPELPATALDISCYYEMFRECTSLTVAPALPATIMKDYCYQMMFYGCTSLKTAPVLPSSTLASYCYYWMFYGCSNLKVDTDGPGYAWGIPSGASEFSQWNYKMLESTGGTFKGEPTIGTTYYLTSTPSVKLNSAGYATYSTYFNAHIETEGVKAYKATVNRTTVTLTELDGDIPAGMGVILYGEGLDNNTTVTFSASSTAATNASDNALKPTTVKPGVKEAKSAGKVVFALGGGEEFLHYKGSSFAHNRAYLQFDTDPCPSSSHGGKTMTIVFADDVVTGIDNVNVNDNSSLYNLQGVRVGESYKGVVIKNGLKYINK